MLRGREYVLNACYREGCRRLKAARRIQRPKFTPEQRG